jgi:hypothetical protein
MRRLSQGSNHVTSGQVFEGSLVALAQGGEEPVRAGPQHTIRIRSGSSG